MLAYTAVEGLCEVTKRQARIELIELTVELEDQLIGWSCPWASYFEYNLSNGVAFSPEMYQWPRTRSNPLGDRRRKLRGVR